MCTSVQHHTILEVWSYIMPHMTQSAQFGLPTLYMVMKQAFEYKNIGIYIQTQPKLKDLLFIFK